MTNGAEYGLTGESDPIQVDYNCQGMETSLMECSQRVRMRSWCRAYFMSVVLKCRVLNIPGIIIIIMINLPCTLHTCIVCIHAYNCCVACLTYSYRDCCISVKVKHHFQFSTSKKIWDPNASNPSIQIEFHRTHAYLVCAKHCQLIK